MFYYYHMRLKENRSNSLTYYGLYPNHHLSTPALHCNAMLNMTKIELELISDVDMYSFKMYERCSFLYL